MLHIPPHCKELLYTEMLCLNHLSVLRRAASKSGGVNPLQNLVLPCSIQKEFRILRTAIPAFVRNCWCLAPFYVDYGMRQYVSWWHHTLHYIKNMFIMIQLQQNGNCIICVQMQNRARKNPTSFLAGVQRCGEMQLEAKKGRQSL